MRHPERAQHDGVHQREDGRMGADSEREGQHRHRGKAFTLAPLAQGEAKILAKLLW